jgi:ABC-2 type transport system ATP-binding protein
VSIAAQPAPPSPVPDDEAGVIRTVALTKVFAGRGGTVRAVESLDLTVRRGEVFGLLGPNGAGKTTTVGMLTTRVIPTSGEAWVGGVDVVAHPAAAKQVIGVVPQTNTLDRSLDVAENLFFHGRYFGMNAREAHQRTDQLLEQFRLADRAHAGADELSGGMAQRLMVARAIMHDPDVLFLDEPTSGLDPQSRLALWDVIGELHAQGQTIVLTTHYMEEADQLCERVAIIDHGRLLALDTPSELKAAVGAETELRIQATGDLRALADDLARMPGVASAHVIDDTVYANVTHGGPTLSDVITHADHNGFKVSDVGIKETTLETVFINLTGRDLRE